MSRGLVCVQRFIGVLTVEKAEEALVLFRNVDAHEHAGNVAAEDEVPGAHAVQDVVHV